MKPNLSAALYIFSGVLLWTTGLARESEIRFIPYVPVMRYHGPTGPIYVTVRSQSQWEIVWSEITAPFTMPPPPTVGQQEPTQELKHDIEPVPFMEFQQFTLVVAAIGRRYTTGESVSFVSFQTSDHIVRATVLNAVPGKECLVTSGVMSPIAFALIPRTDLPIQIEMKTEARDCVSHGH